MSKRVLVICPHPEGVAPGQRLKYEQYFSCFRDEGFEVEVSPFMTSRFWDIAYRRGHYLEKILWTLFGYLRRVADLFRLPFYDCVYICLWVTPFEPALFERLFRAANSRIIYDLDDMIFLKPKSKANGFISLLKADGKIFYLLKAARHVIVCTPKLAEIAGNQNANVTDISSTINMSKYLRKPLAPSLGPVTIGWSGSHSTSKYLVLLADVLRDVRREREFRLLVIGDPELRIEGLTVTGLPWVEPTEVADLHRIDIGLYPLPREEWVFGKSGLKALQYQALGIPVVATAIGTNYRVIEDGVTGFLVNSPDEWKKALIRLIDDPAKRRTMGDAARARVDRLYSIEANKESYLRILRDVTSGKP